jgi:hypothetical protein
MPTTRWGGFRVWWRQLHNGSDEQLDDNHLMRMAGGFARRVKAWGVANQVPVIYCKSGERKHRIAEEYLATRPGWNRLAGGSNGSRPGRANRRCRGGSSPRPRPPWPSCSPRRWASWTWPELMVGGVHFGDRLCVVRARYRDRRHQGPARAGRGIDREHHHGDRSAGRPCGNGGWTPAADPGRYRRCGSARGGGEAGVRPPGDPASSTAQTAQRHRPVPGDLGAVVGKPMRRAYHADTALAASARLEALARALERTHPGAAGSLREGPEETLTVPRLNVPPSLARTLRSTNAIESMI